MRGDDLALGNDDVQVGKFAQGNVAICLRGENRSLVRSRGDAATFESRQNAEEFGRKRQVAAGGFKIRPAEALAPRRGQRGWGAVLKIFANERGEGVFGGRGEEHVPVRLARGDCENTL